MEKLLVFLVMIGVLGVMVLVSIGVAVAGDQDVDVEVDEVIDISVNDIDFGTVIPGTNNDEISQVTVEANNNVNLTVTISITDAGAGNLFHHLIFDVEDNGFGDNSEIEDGSETKDIDDDSGTTNIDVRLAVPIGFSPGINSGIVNYVAMKRVI